jgi:hypothetical protein
MNKFLCSAALVAAGFAGSASATTVNVSYQPGGVFGPSTLKQNINVSSPGHNGGVQAGLFHLTGDNGVGDFVAFCVDLAQYLHDPTEYTVQSSWFSSEVVTNVDKLFNTVLGGSTIASVIDTSLEAAGFQVALWEILYDTPASGAGDMYDLASGSFSVSGNAAAKLQAESYLDGIPGAAMGGYDYTWFYSGTKQDVLTATPTPIPVPAAGLLMLGGLGGLAALRRRRKARHA